MGLRKAYCLMALFAAVAAMGATVVMSASKNEDAKAATNYLMLTPKARTGQERAFCRGRKANCDGYGALCYDPRFVGGDGVMFYFHGAKGGNFAIFSDENLHINAHFIGSRPTGRTRDYTWVQALSIMFDTHTLDLAAKTVSKWDDEVDSLVVRWDGETVGIPTDGEAEWRVNGEEREVVVERTDDANSVRVTVEGLLELDVKVTPIGEKENKVHNYQLPENDAFAHLETQFRFKSLTDQVEGVLGKTYRPDYVSPVKKGVPMPMMGGEDKYYTSSLHSTVCNACVFRRPSGAETTAHNACARIKLLHPLAVDTPLLQLVDQDQACGIHR